MQSENGYVHSNGQKNEYTQSVNVRSVFTRVCAVLNNCFGIHIELTPETELKTLNLSSIRQLELWVAIKDNFSVKLDMEKLNRIDTVYQLCELVEEQISIIVPVTAEHPTATEYSEKSLPLSPIQQSYWVAAQNKSDPDAVGCLLYYSFKVLDLDLSRLSSAWSKLVNATPVLRMCVDADGQLSIKDKISNQLIHVYNEAFSTEVSWQNHLRDIRAQFTKKISNGEYGFRVAVSHRGNGDSVVHLSINGILVDGLSINILLSKWYQAYLDLSIEWPAEECDIKQALLQVAAKRKQLNDDKVERYWDERLCSFQPNFNSLLSQEHAQQNLLPRDSISTEIGSDTWSKLKVLAEQSSVSPTVFVLTAFCEVLRGRLNNKDVSLLLTTNNRPWLQSEASRQLIGPFTGSLLFSASELSSDFETNATHIKKLLWQDLSNNALDGVEVIRRYRALHKKDIHMPLVFTSLLDIGLDSVPENPFQKSLCCRSSHTTGVWLEHEMWEEDNALKIHWDYAPQYFALGEIERLFSRLIQTLQFLALDDYTKSGADINALQQAYLVSRFSESSSLSRSNRACNILQSFHVKDFDYETFQVAVVRWINQHECLRTYFAEDANKKCLAAELTTWDVAVIDLTSADDSVGALSQVKSNLIEKYNVLGITPCFEIVVTKQSQHDSYIHIVMDLAMIDAISIRQIAHQLFEFYANENFNFTPLLSEHDWYKGKEVVENSPLASDWESYWQKHLRTAPSGPSLDHEVRPVKRTRLTTELTQWPLLRRGTQRLGVSCDALLSALFALAIAKHAKQSNFTIPVVCWDDETDRFRPGEYTSLTWLVCSLEALAYASNFVSFVRECNTILIERVEGAVSKGLGILKKRSFNSSSDFQFPVVYTSLWNEASYRLPENVRALDWLTATPDVSLDMICVETDDKLNIFWDAVESDFTPGAIREGFEDLQRAIDLLSSKENWNDIDVHEMFALPVQENSKGGEHRADEMPAAEFEKIIYDWNATETAYSKNKLPIQLFEQQVDKYAKKTALVSANQEITYKELNNWANSIANMLIHKGAAPEVIVALSIEPSPLMIATVLAIHKAGAAYLPLDPTLPSSRKQDILKDSAAKIYLQNEQAKSDFTCDFDCEFILLNEEVPKDVETSVNPQINSSVKNSSYLIYTSGSTGKPKGVLVAHHGLLNLINWAKNRFNFDAQDMGLLVASLSFDLSVFDIFGVLGCGGSLYVANTEERKDPNLLFDVLVEQRITFWNSSPAMLFQLKERMASSDLSLADQTLRLVFLSGDFTPLSLPKEVKRCFQRSELINLGGATEATVWSNYYPVESVNNEWRSIPYGKPIDNSQYYILDESLQVCGIGREGDLYIAGDCLTLGYWKRPSLTAQQFIPNPFSSEPGQRMYKTGDRAVYLSDGNISFIGRSDGQVKIHGYRIELGEIEHQLRAHPNIEDVTLQVKEDDLGDKKLIAYLIANGSEMEVKLLRAYCSQFLPEYMVPNFFFYIDTFPSTSNGKLDRKALPWPLQQSSSTIRTKSSESDEVRQQLFQFIKDLLCKQLNSNSIQGGQDLWDLGLTSFNMIQVTNAIRKRYQCNVNVSALMNDPSLNGLYEVVAKEVLSHLEDNGHVERASVAQVECEGEHGSTVNIDSIDLCDKEAVDKFKALNKNQLLRQPDSIATPLHNWRKQGSWQSWRANQRQFEKQTIAREDFERFLSVLCAVEGGKLYPSAGGTYAVQIFLYLNDNAVEGFGCGWYHYDPLEHQLHSLTSEERLQHSDHFFYNRDIYSGASFSLFMLGQQNAIKPLYRESAQRYLMLEAGYMGQLLMLAQASCNIGVTIIGDMNVERLQKALPIDEGHLYLQSFVGGSVNHTGENCAGNQNQQPNLPFLNTSTPEELAIVGVAGRYPEANDTEELWQNLLTGKQVRNPLERLEIYGNANSGLLGGFLDDITGFDSQLFNVAPSEAASLDPQTRLLLHTVWECLEQSSHNSISLNTNGAKVGVFVAVMWHDYLQQGANKSEVVASLGSDIANRISHFFHFTGPSIAVNTSCSSSLTALHLARQSILSGECESAVVCAVNLFADKYHGQILKDLNLLASSNCSGLAYDSSNDGWIPGEGCGALLLRNKEVAVTQKDRVLSWLNSTHVSHAGSENRYATPNVERLTASIRETLQIGNIQPEDICYVEAAASGANMADLAELEALQQVFDREGCHPWLGSIKPNIGHLEAASGMAQLTKAILQLQKGQIAPTQFGTELVDWQNIKLIPCVAAEILERNAKNACLVNAVGATGSYAHALITPALESKTGDTIFSHDGDYFFPLSACTQTSLQLLASRIAEFVDVSVVEKEANKLASIAYSLQQGRRQLSKRAVIRTHDMRTLKQALICLSKGESHTHLEYANQLSLNLNSKIQRWLKGEEINWTQFWRQTPVKIALPSYPFEMVSYWLDKPSYSNNVCIAEKMTDDVAVKNEVYVWLQQHFAHVTQIPVTEVESHIALDSYGLSSAIVLQMNSVIKQRYKNAPTSLFYQYKTLGEIAEHLTGLLPMSKESALLTKTNGKAPAGTKMSSGFSSAKNGTRNIAIIGVSGKYPQADTLDQYWRNLAQGKNSVRQIPENRLQANWSSDQMWGGFLEQVDKFDPLFFNIAPRDAALIDPQTRLFLQVVWNTLQNAGYPPSRIRDVHNGSCGVYVGSMYSEYSYFGVEETLRGNVESSDTSNADIANRVSYFMDINGPSMTIDTMCSSSLTAIHLAAEALWRGEVELAIAGGVNLSLHPNKFVTIDRLKMRSPDNLCKSFSADADGFIPGEGAGAVLLKTLAQAEKDGDRILAVIKGSAVNHGGRSNGYMVPNADVQSRLIEKAMQSANLNPADIQYIEAHGTGTSLGDPIEVEALTRAYNALGDCTPEINIGSVKSAIGHLEAAAGIAGLTKVLLQMQYKQIVPTLHATELNPNINWEQIPFKVQTELQPWETEPEQLMAAGISSFGAGGTNAHVVVQEYRVKESAAPLSSHSDNGTIYFYLPVSGHTERALASNLKLLLSYLSGLEEGESTQNSDTQQLVSALTAYRKKATLGWQETSGDVNLSVVDSLLAQLGSQIRHDTLLIEQLAFSLQVGREAFKHRVCFLVSDIEDAQFKIKQYLEGKSNSTPIIAKDKSEVVLEPTPSSTNHQEIIEHWLVGGSVRWEKLYPDGFPHILTLPDYPFEQDHCWIKQSAHTKEQYFANKVQVVQKSWTESAGHLAVEPEHSESFCIAIVNDITERLIKRMKGSLPWQRLTSINVDCIDFLRKLTRLINNEKQIIVLDLVDLTHNNTHFEHRLQALQFMLKQASMVTQILHLTSTSVNPLCSGKLGVGAKVASLIEAIAQEHRSSHIKTVSLSVELDAELCAHEVAEIIKSECSLKPDYRQIRYINGAREVPSLRWQELTRGEPFIPDSESVYVLTGGTRGIGAMIAKEWVKRGARKLVILSSTSWSEKEDVLLSSLEREAKENVMALRKMGAVVKVFSGLERIELADCVQDIQKQLGPIDGVFHCAGSGSNGSPAFTHKSEADFESTLKPKISLLEDLVSALMPVNYRFFLSFSSVSAVFPQLAAGVSDYALANSMMDKYAIAVAEEKNKKLISINWPFWQRTDDESSLKACLALGLKPISDAQGIEFIDTLLNNNVEPNVAFLPSRDKPADLNERLKVSRNLPQKQKVTPQVERTEKASDNALKQQVRHIIAQRLGMVSESLDVNLEFAELGVESVMMAELLSDLENHVGFSLEPHLLLDYPTVNQLSEQLAIHPSRPVDKGNGNPTPPRVTTDLTGALVEIISQVTEIASGDLDRNASFSQLGIESVMLAELMSRLEARFGVFIEPTALLEHDSIARLEQFLSQLDLALSELKIDSVQEKTSDKNKEYVTGDVAIIGASGCFPSADNLAEYWEILAEGRCVIDEVPSSRWNTKMLFDPAGHSGKSVSKWGGFLNDIEHFDAAFFEMSEKEASETDPAIRMMLEQACLCLCNAGYEKQELDGQAIDVYVGARISNYRKRMAGKLGAAGLGGDQNFIAARIAHFMNWHGTNLVVDSACSSSLNALKLACQSIRVGDTQMALVGGVDLLLDEEYYLEFTEAKALSSKGRCQVFDKSADGFVPGEGGGAVLLKSLQQAKNDGDRILGVIKGVASNNDGKTMGLTTPNPKAQQQVIETALKRASLTAQDVGMVEAHGTGTKIGDPIELRALNEVFNKQASENHRCAVASVKSNIGHLLSAAGIASLCKVLLALENKTIPATLHCDEPNPRFNFESSSLYLPLENEPWQEINGNRVAGISAFGLGGSNVHVIVSDEAAQLSNYIPQRQPLPYPKFEKQRHWIEANAMPSVPTVNRTTQKNNKKPILALNFD
ncbi:amino acid adenylation domain-containing protein [Endozoicomonas sp. G2_1]|uniref:non-ribosomal peptide synthetase n=1 Tax=Endozoicomonas sp. G2_1 TaxID=2821091 RepID=UPI001ADB0F6D|nr:non-ribosomal peptide synthetase [Endozoicomonas sp. G2_1]MBO9489817.1 amino acid adenylation domain-containing protein [Endozoicomonas sp. G2_1]